MGSSCCLGSNVVTLIFSCLQVVKHLSRGARSRSRPQIFGFSTHDSSVVDACMRGSVGVYSVPSAVYRSLPEDRKSTRLNSSHVAISYAVFCLKKKK